MNSRVLGNRIKGIMIMNSVKRKDLADKLGVTYNTITRKLKGEREFSYSELLQIKQILEIDDELYTSILFDSAFILEKNNKVY
ncbi:MAG: helix-turn-helix transcriptional regulator [Bacilli bacterium]|nr:helix-turn-helix transcriptional regulator [Bacilli bacterium]